jgi:release factor glutamine methyltransferase
LDSDWLNQAIGRVNNHEPVQYVIGKADFLGRSFNVNPSVLIPRPETEELVAWLGQQLAATFKADEKIRVLDIGTGSGCIAISLALLRKNALVYATDVSEGALHTAATNAHRWMAEVHWLKHDILTEYLPLRDLDLVVSNPPYIHPDEQITMAPHVLNHEPATALFAQSEDALIFYRAIGNQAKRALRPGGILAVEINALYAKEVEEIFFTYHYQHIRIMKDLAGKDRFVIANRPDL